MTGALALALALVATACSLTATDDVAAVVTEAPPLPPAPRVPDGPVAAEVAEDLDEIFGSIQSGVDPVAVERVGESGDARVAWLMADLLRFFIRDATGNAAEAAFRNLTGTDPDPDRFWLVANDYLIAWDLPEPPGYVGWKRQLFEAVEPGWEPFFADPDSEIDWRLITWGGVLIDDRPRADDGSRCPRGCIPALDDPQVTDAAGGDWYPDDAIVFGVALGGEARAYPKNIMEVHEMVNDTIGGRRLGIPYCTLCGSAQAFYTDEAADGQEIELRTSGLLSRSNKVMFDLNTFSVFDTFIGRARSGPLREQEVQLAQASVVTSTWGEWKAEHPDTTIVAEDGGIGRTYAADPLQGRDDDGPIFPVGDVDPRLPVQEQVLGAEAPDGTAVAFPVAAARAALDSGEEVSLAGVRLVADGSGVRAELVDGGEVGGHQAFWFAWSQFRPDTVLWMSPVTTAG